MVGAWLVDSTGKAVRPGINWEDSRSQEVIDRMTSADPNVGSRIFQSSGSVLQQDPDPGEAVAPATGVNLLLAMSVPRERYVMPDLVYRNYEQVRPYFEQLGFKFGSVKFERYEGVAAGVILRQFPLPGHPLTREDAVSLVVATADAVP